MKQIPISAILRASLPAIRAAIKEAQEARQKDSPGGRKITRDEWKQILKEAFEAEIDFLASQLFLASKQE